MSGGGDGRAGCDGDGHGRKSLAAAALHAHAVDGRCVVDGDVGRAHGRHTGAMWQLALFGVTSLLRCGLPRGPYGQPHPRCARPARRGTWGLCDSGTSAPTATSTAACTGAPPASRRRRRPAAAACSRQPGGRGSAAGPAGDRHAAAADRRQPQAIPGRLPAPDRAVAPAAAGGADDRFRRHPAGADLAPRARRHAHRRRADRRPVDARVRESRGHRSRRGVREGRERGQARACRRAQDRAPDRARRRRHDRAGRDGPGEPLVGRAREPRPPSRSSRTWRTSPRGGRSRARCARWRPRSTRAEPGSPPPPTRARRRRSRCCRRGPYSTPGRPGARTPRSPRRRRRSSRGTGRATRSTTSSPTPATGPGSRCARTARETTGAACSSRRACSAAPALDKNVRIAFAHTDNVRDFFSYNRQPINDARDAAVDLGRGPVVDRPRLSRAARAGSTLGDGRRGRGCRHPARATSR